MFERGCVGHWGTRLRWVRGRWYNENVAHKLPCDELGSGSARFLMPGDMNQGSTAARWFRRAWAAGVGLGDSFVAVCLRGVPSNFSYLTFVSPGTSVTKTNSMDLR